MIGHTGFLVTARRLADRRRRRPMRRRRPAKGAYTGRRQQWRAAAASQIAGSTAATDIPDDSVDAERRSANGSRVTRRSDVSVDHWLKRPTTSADAGLGSNRHCVRVTDEEAEMSDDVRNPDQAVPPALERGTRRG